MALLQVITALTLPTTVTNKGTLASLMAMGIGQKVTATEPDGKEYIFPFKQAGKDLSTYSVIIQPNGKWFLQVVQSSPELDKLVLDALSAQNKLAGKNEINSPLQGTASSSSLPLVLTLLTLGAVAYFFWKE